MLTLPLIFSTTSHQAIQTVCPVTRTSYPTPAHIVTKFYMLSWGLLLPTCALGSSLIPTFEENFHFSAESSRFP